MADSPAFMPRTAVPTPAMPSRPSRTVKVLPSGGEAAKGALAPATRAENVTARGGGGEGGGSLGQGPRTERVGTERVRVQRGRRRAVLAPMEARVAALSVRGGRHWAGNATLTDRPTFLTLPPPLTTTF